VVDVHHQDEIHPSRWQARVRCRAADETHVRRPDACRAPTQGGEHLFLDLDGQNRPFRADGFRERKRVIA
jgi:hypothetical protein